MTSLDFMLSIVGWKAKGKPKTLLFLKGHFYRINILIYSTTEIVISLIMLHVRGSTAVGGWLNVICPNCRWTLDKEKFG